MVLATTIGVVSGEQESINLSVCPITYLKSRILHLSTFVPGVQEKVLRLLWSYAPTEAYHSIRTVSTNNEVGSKTATNVGLENSSVDVHQK